MKTIYLDNAATTKPLSDLNAFLKEYTSALWQNPSALYAPAVQVQKRMNEARKTLLDAVGLQGTHKCVFTSCGTEAANMAILHGARAKKNRNYVCGGAEHPCVEESFRQLEAQGIGVKWVKPDSHGNITAQDVAQAVDENTVLASVMHVNNETGAKNDVGGIAAAVKAKNPDTLFFADGVQAYLRESASGLEHVDYYTVSAHKIHAFKGTGALFYKKGAPIKPLLLGGGQEETLRSGTENTLGILAFAQAVDSFLQGHAQKKETLAMLRAALLGALEDVEGMHVISPQREGDYCNHIVNLSFEGINGETLLHSLEADGIYISTGSACSSKKGRGRIAKMLSMSDEMAFGSVRISFSPFNTEQEVLRTAEGIKKHIALLRRFKRK